jgi:hypothetical protein
MVISSPLDSEQRRKGRPPAVIAGEPGHGDGWEVGQKGEGDEED